MDANSLKNAGIRLVIISRSRSKSISGNTCKIFPEWVEVLVPESEETDYRNSIRNPLITVPDDVQGLGMLRNYCVQTFPEEIVIMIDDDIKYCYRMTKEKSERVSGQELVEVIVNAAIMARDAGCHFFGFNQTDIRKYNGTKPFGLNGWVGTVVGVIGKEMKFISDPFKVDIDFSLQNLEIHRIIWIDNRYYFRNNKDCNVGGNSLYRNKDNHSKSFKKLKDKWGKYVQIKEAKGVYRVRTNVERSRGG